MNERLQAALQAGDGLILLRSHRRLRGSIYRAVARGELERVFRGVYAVAGSVTAAVRCAALQLLDPDAVWTGDTAAWLARLPGAKEPTVLTAASTRRWRNQHIRTTRRRIDPDFVTQTGRLRRTTVALTTLDRARQHGADPIDDALRAGVTLGALRHTLSTDRRRVGNRGVRRLLHDSRDEPWSAAERCAHRLLRRAGITGWRANLRVASPQGVLYLDLGFERLRLDIEIDGFSHHGSRAAFEADRARDVQLARIGWSSHRFTAAQVMLQPDAFVAAVRALSRAADRRLHRPPR